MTPALLELLCCPNCGAALKADVDTYGAGGEYWEGTLSCGQCSEMYAIREGMPHLYVEDERWVQKAREAQGWVTLHKDLGIYEVVEDAVDLKIPYYAEEPWIRVAQSFDDSLKLLDLDGTETILDLGAGRGWASKQFALRGCRVVALDIVPDENVGLGRGKAIMEDAGVYFERLIADGENLPLRPESFDLVFCAATLHHTSHLALVLQNVNRVLKAGGRLCAINEPCIAIYEDEREALEASASHELEVGINETRPDLMDYRRALREADLDVIELFPVVARKMKRADLRRWAQDQGFVWPAAPLRRPAHFARAAYRFLSQRARALAKGTYFEARRFMTNGTHDDLETTILLWGRNEILLLAEKEKSIP